MANSKVVQWQGGSRASASGSNAFLLKQSREPYGSVPKTDWAFTLWLVENGFGSANYNSPDAAAEYIRLREQFFSACGGGDGGLLFGIQVVRKDRTLLPRQSDVRLRTTWGGLQFKGTKNIEETIYVDVNNSDEVNVTDYFVNSNSPERVLLGYYNNHARWVSSYRWTEGGVFNSDGDYVTYWQDLLPTREIDAQGNLKLSFSQKLIGTLSIFINHQIDDYVLTIYPRDLGSGQDIYDEQKVYDTTILGFGNGEYISMPLEIPEDAADCIPYTQVIDPETGRYITVIEGSDTHNAYDSDGDGYLDGGADADECTCWMCGGTGILPDCIESATQDCTCPNCSGTGILPACQDEENETNNSYYYYYRDSSDDDDDGTDKPYTLEVDLNQCTNQVEDWDIKKN